MFGVCMPIGTALLHLHLLLWDILVSEGALLILEVAVCLHATSTPVAQEGRSSFILILCLSFGSHNSCSLLVQYIFLDSSEDLKCLC